MLAKKLFEKKKIEKRDGIFFPFIDSENPLYFWPTQKKSAVFSILVQ
jgi:hypothetical protein